MLSSRKALLAVFSLALALVMFALLSRTKSKGIDNEGIPSPSQMASTESDRSDIIARADDDKPEPTPSPRDSAPVDESPSQEANADQSSDSVVEEIEPPGIPAALAEPLPASGKWNPEQIELFYRLRQEFVNAVANGSRDPASPEYLRKWQEAGKLSDERFRAFFGDESYNTYHRAVSGR